MKRHSTILCASQSQKTASDKGEKESKEACTTTTAHAQSAQSVTLLQTVIVNIEHRGKTIPVRTLFDSGSQRSYIKDEVVKKLQLPSIKEEVLTHSLFGGVQTNSKCHSVYNIKINSLDDTYSTVIAALSQNVLCENVPKFDSPNLHNLLCQNHITLTDVGENIQEIGLLIGSDYLGLFLTGKIIHLQQNGLVAVHTKLGWTLQGKLVSTNINNTTTTLFCNDNN